MEKQNLQFRIAKTAEELEAVFHLRFLGYTQSKNKMLDPDYFPDQRECDQFDAIAINFLAQDLYSGDYLGCVRLVPDSAIGLPLEQERSLAHFRSLDKKIMEHSRMVSWPPGQPEVNFGLMAATAQYSIRQGLTHWVGMGMAHMKSYYESRGFFQIEPYEEFTLPRKGGYLLNQIYFLTAFDFARILRGKAKDLPSESPFQPDQRVFRYLDQDPRIVLE